MYSVLPRHRTLRAGLASLVLLLACALGSGATALPVRAAHAGERLRLQLCRPRHGRVGPKRPGPGRPRQLQRQPRLTGDITRWSDPAITATNGGKKLPDQPVKVVYRTGRSGTTALFYDFVADAASDVYQKWRSRLNLPNRRIVELPDSGGVKVAPNIVGFTTSDTMASYVASNNGEWSIGYDEFGYAIKHNLPAAWVKNARLRPDLSQELSGVYTSKRPKAYPISAYSYIMVQCQPAADRQTRKGKYPNGGTTDTLAKFMRYVACDGQVKMARIGYSPMPPNLSQEMMNSAAIHSRSCPAAWPATPTAAPQPARRPPAPPLAPARVRRPPAPRLPATAPAEYETPNRPASTGLASRASERSPVLALLSIIGLPPAIMAFNRWIQDLKRRAASAPPPSAPGPTDMADPVK